MDCLLQGEAFLLLLSYIFGPLYCFEMTKIWIRIP